MRRFAATILMVLLLAIIATSSEAMTPYPFKNPKGQEPSDLVKEVMKKYGIEEGEPRFLDAGTWVYASETSAVVAVETDLRTIAYLFYSEGGTYEKLLRDEEFHYIHVFHLKDLKPDTTYHFDVGVTTRNHKGVATGRRTLRTKTMKDAVRIPDDLEGPPFELNKPGTTYLVTEDIVAPKTAFNITASGVTLDLGGRMVCYNEEHLGLPTDSFNNMLRESAFGVRVRGRGVDRNVKILGGTLIQGKGNDEGSYTSIGFNPIYLSGGAGSEIAGVKCIYAGKQMSGIVTHWCGPQITIHHNVVEDRGRLIANRHRQNKAIVLASTGGKAYNNLVKRTRHVGIGGGAKNAEIYGNEIHVDSHAINGGGVGAKADSNIHHNRIFGCGNNVVAVATTGGASSANVKVHHNYVWLHAHDIAEYGKFLSKKAMESAAYSIMSGARITWGCENPEYYDNVFLMTARDGGKIRGTFFYGDANSKGAVFHDNLVIAIAENEKSDGWGAIGGVGTRSKGEPVPILFKNNTIVSNFTHFSLKDNYGTAQNYRFVGNTFVKVGDRADYATIRGRRGYTSSGHVFLDSTFEGGAGYDRIAGLNQDDFEVQWTLTLEAPAGADVKVADAAGAQVFAGKIGADGRRDVSLTEYKFAKLKKTPMTPHTIIVTSGGRAVTRTVTMNATKTIQVEP